MNPAPHPSLPRERKRSKNGLAGGGASPRPSGPRWHSLALFGTGFAGGARMVKVPHPPGIPDRTRRERRAVTKDYQRLPKMTENEILKRSRLPGEAGQTPPRQPRTVARQNPDVKEQPRRNADNPTRRRQGISPVSIYGGRRTQAAPNATCCIIYFRYSYVQRKLHRAARSSRAAQPPYENI